MINKFIHDGPLRKLHVTACQRQFKSDPLIGNIANLKLTHPWHLGVG
jgi:hypothetical protein